MAERRARRGADLPGLGAVAATYVYFLIWAQFGLLARMRAAGLGVDEIRLAMAAMGLAGLAASFAAARWSGGRGAVAAALTTCAGAALASLAAGSSAGFALAAAGVGAATAWATVALAGALPALIGPRRRGLAVGAATGFAYFACNLPALFEAPAAAQAGVAAALCLAAAAGLRFGPARDEPPAPLAGAPPEPTFRGLAWVALVASFLALVWLDSAAFAIIQENAALRRLTWAEGNVKLALGAVHLAAALAAGWWSDRGGLRRLPLLAFTALATAALALDRLAPGLVAGLLYAAGVSFYSVPLVLAPAARFTATDPRGPARRAAQLYGIAGWLGSAAGIGMAQDLHRIPGAFLIAAAALLAAAAALDRRRALALALGKLAPALAVVLAGGVIALPGSDSGTGSTTFDPPIARGRAVYVAEGCVNCHSQFVRPGSRDEMPWGPARPLDRRQRPPLVGNRRQGPDLAAVGLRRDPVWNRLHLIDPRALSPDSRMPSYAHLFAPGDPRGAALVEYLASLGAGDGAARLAAIAVAPAPDGPPAPGGARLFRGLCAPCHGERGRGDGPLAGNFPAAAIDLRKERLTWVAPLPDGGADPAALARVIRWGVPGTAMAGHETLAAGEIAALAAEVAALRAPRTAEARP